MNPTWINKLAQIHTVFNTQNAEQIEIKLVKEVIITPGQNLRITSLDNYF